MIILCVSVFITIFKEENLKSSELRRMYLDFFEGKGHAVKASWPLVPEDNTLLFNVAGMVPFKNYFLGRVPLSFTRAASCQKCIRTNDIENVGKTRRHHTFFEMLGNFSFGDYFKEEAIAWAWEFLTEKAGLPKERMYVTVYKTDDEAFNIWKNRMKVPEERIFRLGEATNFWEMGTVGPCGYCSEIYFDLEGKTGVVTRKDIEENNDRFLEIWNLVFIEFDKKEDGSLGPLAQKNIDTGMGIERLAAVCQGKYSNFETDLFMPIIKDAAEKCGVQYGVSEKHDVSLRVIADHARSVVFLIGDGVLPSNEGRGYVLRRVLRRAIRHGRLLGMKEPFLFKAVPVVIGIMEGAYPEIVLRKEYITQIIKLEEDKFQDAMDNGLEMLNKEIEAAKKSSLKELPGEAAFKLYDTFGFPAEITAEILQENGLGLDMKQFKENMEKQREMAKKAWKGVSAELSSRAPKHAIEGMPVTEFLGYEKLEARCKVISILKKGGTADRASAGEEADAVLDATPFYAESGGQAGDKGLFYNDTLKAEVVDTQKIEGIYLHRLKITSGHMEKGTVLTASVDRPRREAIMKNHTSTHLLHSALKAILGPHVEQAGSHVSDDRLRFDFTHFAALTGEEIRKTERMVNLWIQQASPVCVEEMEIEDAKKRGAIALFEDKYKDRVRTVGVEGVSMELCGGTHLKNTGEAGLFKITSSVSTAAGVRRIEAVTGPAALAMLADYDDFVRQLKDRFKAKDTAELNEKIAKLGAELREKEREIQKLKTGNVVKNASDYISSAVEVNGIKVLTISLQAADKDSVRSLGDVLREKMKKAVIVIANADEDKANFLAVVTQDITDRYDAAAIVKKAAAVCKGGGGGRRDMAEAGAKDPSKIKEALETVYESVKGA